MIRTKRTLMLAILIGLMLLNSTSIYCFAVQEERSNGRVDIPTPYRFCGNQSIAKMLSISRDDSDLNKTQYLRVKQDLKTLEDIGFNTSCISSAKIDGSNIQFKVVLGNYKDLIQVVENSKDSTTLKIVEGSICNILTINKNGNIFLDGNPVTSSKAQASYTNPIEVEPLGGYKAKWSLNPFVKSYPRYVTSGTENVFLGKCIDAVALTTFTYCLGKLVPYAAELLAATSMGVEIYSYLKKWDPHTKYLGCKYKTYASGAYDFKYVAKLYPNKKCSGSKYKTTVTYARFRWV